MIVRVVSLGIRVGAGKVVKLSELDHFLLLFERYLAVALVPHVRLDAFCAASESVAPQTLEILKNLGLHVPQEALGIDEVGLLGDKKAMDFGHMGNAEFPGGRVVVAEKTLRDWDGRDD